MIWRERKREKLCYVVKEREKIGCVLCSKTEKEKIGYMLCERKREKMGYVICCEREREDRLYDRW